MQKYRDSFAVSEIGRIYAQLPLKELAEKIRSHNPKRHPQGNSPMFPPETIDVPQYNRNALFYAPKTDNLSARMDLHDI